MTDNTQELDEILNTYAKAYYEAKHESELNTCDWAMGKAKQAILDWHNKQILAEYTTLQNNQYLTASGMTYVERKLHEDD